MTGSKREEHRGQFRSGRAKTGGRVKGTPNRATRAVKEFLSELLTEADVQEAVRKRLLAGDTTAFFRAIEIVHGKPRQAQGHEVVSPIVVSWKGWPK